MNSFFSPQLPCNKHPHVPGFEALMRRLEQNHKCWKSSAAWDQLLCSHYILALWSVTTSPSSSRGAAMKWHVLGGCTKGNPQNLIWEQSGRDSKSWTLKTRWFHCQLQVKDSLELSGNGNSIEQQINNYWASLGTRDRAGSSWLSPQGTVWKAGSHLLAVVVLFAFLAGAFFCWVCFGGWATLGFFSSSALTLCFSFSFSLSFFFFSFSFFSFFFFGLFTGAWDSAASCSWTAFSWGEKGKLIKARWLLPPQTLPSASRGVSISKFKNPAGSI